MGRLRAAGCVYAEDEAALLLASSESAAALADRVARRVAGEPLEQILGWAEFCGLRVVVEPTVFVPRRRTEFLVYLALATLGRGDPAPVVLDLCCGSGALGLAVRTARPDVALYAADVDPAAVHCARRNLEPVGGRVHAGDLFDPLPTTLRGRFDVVVVNAPYVPTDEVGLMPSEARVHEARVALDGGPEGLDIHRRVAAAAPGWLTPGGRILIETSRRQAASTAALLAAAGLDVEVRRSEEYDATVAVGTRPGVSVGGE